jgi:hypothetical protein
MGFWKSDFSKEIESHGTLENNFLWKINGSHGNLFRKVFLGIKIEPNSLKICF